MCGVILWLYGCYTTYIVSYPNLKGNHNGREAMVTFTGIVSYPNLKGNHNFNFLLNILMNIVSYPNLKGNHNTLNWV